MRLRVLHWKAMPLKLDSLHSAFFEDAVQFPPGSAVFDSALLMRGIPHEWHELDKPASVRYNKE